LKEVREGVSDRGRGVRSRGERAPAWGTRKPREIDTFNEGLEADGHWEAAGLDVALKLAAQGSKACNRKVEVRLFL
jgi:hypothetical protein